MLLFLKMLLRCKSEFHVSFSNNVFRILGRKFWSMEISALGR